MVNDLILDYMKRDNPDQKILKNLLAFVREEREEEKRKAFFEAMCKFQASCPVLETDNVVTRVDPLSNEEVSFIMPSHNEIKRHALEHAAEHGLFFTIKPVDVVNNDGAVDVNLTIAHKEGYSKTYLLRALVNKPIVSSIASERSAAISIAAKSLIINALGITYEGTEEANKTAQYSVDDLYHVQYPKTLDMEIETKVEESTEELDKDYIVNLVNQKCAKARIGVETLVTHLKGMGTIMSGLEELEEKDLPGVEKEIKKLQKVKNSSKKRVNA